MNTQVWAWILAAAARGLAWFLVAKLGMDAKQADGLAGEVQPAGP